MKIKFKILSGFLLVIAMLFIAGYMSIFEFIRLSRSVSSLIEDNYKTIEAAKTMLEALEREDSGILLLLSGQWKEGRTILDSADSLFYDSYKIAASNITEKDEDKYVEQIEISYIKFKEKWETPIVGTSKENNINWYFKELHPIFLTVKSNIKALMALNQDSMHNEAKELMEKAHRAIMPGIVAIVASLIFLVIFNFFISKFFIKPIGNLILSLRNFNSSTQRFNAGITTNDEFKKLENEIQNLINRIR